MVRLSKWPIFLAAIVWFVFISVVTRSNSMQDYEVGGPYEAKGFAKVPVDAAETWDTTHGIVAEEPAGGYMDLPDHIGVGDPGGEGPVEHLDLFDAEVALDALLANYAERLGQDDIMAVVRGSLQCLVDTQFYYTDEQKQVVLEVAASLEGASPRLGISAGRAYSEEGESGTLRHPTGEVEFTYSIVLDTPWKVDEEPMGYDRSVGGLMALDGNEFRRTIGRVLVDPDGNKSFIKADIGPHPYYYVSGPDGRDERHPDPASLFPHFTPEQEAELERMALGATDAYVGAYGLDPDVLWDRTSGIWWDMKAPGAGQMRNVRGS